jgi:hypothetical protein
MSSSITRFLESRRRVGADGTSAAEGGGDGGVLDERLQRIEQMVRNVSDPARQDPNERVVVIRREGQTPEDEQDFAEHYHWLRNLNLHPDYRNVYLKLFGQRVRLKEVLEADRRVITARRVCHFCGRDFTKQQSMTRYDCIYHPLDYRGDEGYRCCGGHRMSRGCTPCMHMCNTTDIDPMTGFPLYDRVRVPFTLLVSQSVQWPDVRDVLHVEYLRTAAPLQPGDGMFDMTRCYVVLAVHRRPDARRHEHFSDAHWTMSTQMRGLGGRPRQPPLDVYGRIQTPPPALRVPTIPVVATASTAAASATPIIFL